uniref:Uncharacterized protein n=1 Tax=Arundo donax TaxID=35708 RepID=A0A0A9DWT0_ARUDO
MGTHLRCCPSKRIRPLVVFLDPHSRYIPFSINKVSYTIFQNSAIFKRESSFFIKYALNYPLL